MAIIVTMSVGALCMVVYVGALVLDGRARGEGGRKGGREHPT